MTTTAPTDIRATDWARMSWHQRRRYLRRTGRTWAAAGAIAPEPNEVDQFVALMERARGTTRYRIRSVAGAWVIDGTRADRTRVQVAIADTWDEAIRIATTLARYANRSA